MQNPKSNAKCSQRRQIPHNLPTKAFHMPYELLIGLSVI